MDNFLTDALIMLRYVSRVTFTPITSKKVDANSLTRFKSGTLIYVDTTVSLQFVSTVAFAFVRARQIDASTATLVVFTFVNICG